MNKAYCIHYFGLTDQGSVRQANEDVWSVVPASSFFILADGMGGASGGQIAAKRAVESLCAFAGTNLQSKEQKSPQVADLLTHAIEEVNRLIWQMSLKNEELTGMGTTLCCLHFGPSDLTYAHIGDSRIYRLRHQMMQQLTQDDSLASDLLHVGVLKRNELENFPLNHVLTKSLGSKAKVTPTINIIPLMEGDLFLVCSDGLSSVAPSFALQQILQSKMPLPEMAQQFVKLAIERGSPDNITLILIRVEKDNSDVDH